MNRSSANLYAPAPQNPWKGLGCLEDPFRARFDERFVYLGNDQKRGFERLVQSVRAGDGLSLITGAAGSGKTTLLSRLAADLDTSTPLILFLATPPQTLASLVQECRDQKGGAFASLPACSDPADELRTILSGFDPQALPLLLIDEAQSLADGVLGDLLRLTAPDKGAGTGGGRLLQMVLAGDPSLVRRLQTEPVRSLSGPLGCHYRVPALPKPQVSALIRHRLRAAGCENCEPFADDAVARIADYANGVVGTVNNLCRLALFFSAKAGEAQVSVNSVDRGASAVLLSKPGTGFCAPSKSLEPAATRDMAGGSGIGVADAQAGPLPVGTAARSVDRANSEQTSNGHPQGAEVAAVDRDLEPSSWGIHPSYGRSHGPRWVRLVAAMSVLAATGTLLAFHVSSLKHRESGPGTDRVATTLPSDTAPLAPVTAEPVYAVDSEPAGPDQSPGEMPEQVSTAEVSVSPSEDGEPANDVRDREREQVPPVATALRVEKLMAGDAEIDSLLAQAKAHFDADRLVAPRFDNALVVYRQILRVSPENPSALNGVAAVRARLFAYAQAESERGDSVSTRSLLQKIRSIDAEWGQLGDGVSELAERSLDSEPRLSPPGNLRLRVDTGTGKSSP